MNGPVPCLKGKWSECHRVRNAKRPREGSNSRTVSNYYIDTQDTSLEASFPCSLAPSFPRAIPPPLASSLPPPMPRPVPSSLFPIINPPSLNPPLTLRACVASLLPLSLPLLYPSLPLSPHLLFSLAPSLSHIIASSLPPAPCSLRPSHLLFSRAPSLPLAACLPPPVQLNIHCVCIQCWRAALAIV